MVTLILTETWIFTIRTMIKKADKVYIQAGAGIVADSNPESEYNECCNKARALAKVLIP